jgi:hypothetical protein
MSVQLQKAIHGGQDGYMDSTADSRWRSYESVFI